MTIDHTKNSWRPATGQPGRKARAIGSQTHARLKSDIVKARKELVAMGIVRDSGRRKDGQILWELTEIGRAHGQDIIEAAQKPKN